MPTDIGVCVEASGAFRTVLDRMRSLRATGDTIDDSAAVYPLICASILPKSSTGKAALDSCVLGNFRGRWLSRRQMPAKGPTEQQPRNKGWRCSTYCHPSTSTDLKRTSWFRSRLSQTRRTGGHPRSHSNMRTRFCKATSQTRIGMPSYLN